MKIINPGAMQGTGSRCPHKVWYTGPDPQKSTIVLGWAPGTRGQHGPLAVWVSPEDTCGGDGEPDPGLPHGWGPHHSALQYSCLAHRQRSRVTVPVQLRAPASGEGCPGGQGGMRARSRLLEAAWVPPLQPGCGQPQPVHCLAQEVPWSRGLPFKPQAVSSSSLKPVGGGL